MKDPITDQENNKTAAKSSGSTAGATWGPKLFLGVAVAILLFFWWLLIYSGGVTVQH